MPPSALTMTEAPASPFLSVDQAAGELGCKPIAVQRLIAIGKLKAYRVPPDSGPWKIRPTDFEAYVVAGCPNLAMPAVSEMDQWFDDRNVQGIARTFEGQVWKIISANLPAVCPVSAVKTGETYPVAIPAEAMTAIRQLADSPVSAFTIKMPGEKPSPFKNAGQLFLAANLQQRVERLSNPTTKESTVGGKSRLTKLFDSPQAYRGILDQAWAELSKAVISVRRDYRVDPMGNVCTVAFEVGYTTVAPSPLSSFESFVF